MRKVLLTLKMPHGSYVGGIATVINCYLGAKEDFIKHGYSVELFDYLNEKIDSIKPSKLSNVIYGLAQRRNLVQELKKGCSNTIVHIHTSCRFLFFKDILLAKSIKKKFNLPIVLSIHVGDITTVFDGLPNSFRKFSFNILNKYIDKIVFLSPNMMKQFIKEGLKEERAELLLNFHNMSIEKVSKQNDELRMLFVGAIKKDKGIMELLKAMYDLKNLNLHLDICGVLTDNNIRTEFSNYLSILGNRIKLHGYVSGKEKKALFRNSDVLILPSYHEGFPIVILEGIATGNAIISTPVGTTPEIFSDENVLWVKVKDIESLKEAIKNLANNKELLKRMQKSNYEEGKKFSMDSHIFNLCTIYDSLFE